MAGRPREFDVDKGLDIALDVFWRQGYEGTALSDLTEAMGINRPSLYAAYGNKESLFFRAIERYFDGPAAHVKVAFAKPTAREVAECLLRGASDTGTYGGEALGCPMVHSALVAGKHGEAVRAEMESRRRQSQTALAARFERAQAEGDLPADLNADDLARHIWAVTFGISVSAVSGATREELHRVVDLTLAQWPPRPS
ncbi:TetR/AcrR family transcriptional regulator [Spirillospora sp. CA-294931]|uniref:TetR/AcrR family transcriptional regulator n=1 Tax=Spirillospora sp. CA-294931 TaxID=3240042 RepID=UPI003D91114A